MSAASSYRPSVPSDFVPAAAGGYSGDTAVRGKEFAMRIVAACMLTCLMIGCTAFNANNPHEDSPGQPTPDRGPTLCMDGTPPPCTPRS